MINRTVYARFNCSYSPHRERKKYKTKTNKKCNVPFSTIVKYTSHVSYVEYTSLIHEIHASEKKKMRKQKIPTDIY